MITYTCRYSSGHLIRNLIPIIQSYQDELGIKCALEYLQVQVITLVSLLFITMIPIGCKITNFSLYLLVCLFSLNTRGGYKCQLNLLFSGGTVFHVTLNILNTNDGECCGTLVIRILLHVLFKAIGCSLEYTTLPFLPHTYCIRDVWL